MIFTDELLSRHHIGVLLCFALSALCRTGVDVPHLIAQTWQFNEKIMLTARKMTKTVGAIDLLHMGNDSWSGRWAEIALRLCPVRMIPRLNCPYPPCGVRRNVVGVIALPGAERTGQ